MSSSLRRRRLYVKLAKARNTFRRRGYRSLDSVLAERRSRVELEGYHAVERNLTGAPYVPFKAPAVAPVRRHKRER